MHSRPDCPNLIAGHDKARSEGRQVYPPERFEATELGRSASPCKGCWSEEPGWSGWTHVQLDVALRSNESDTSRWEVRFVEAVLMRSGVPAGYVTPQAVVERPVGAPLRPDFVIREPDVSPIAVEIDGDKVKFHGESREHRNLRDADLESLGYRVIHFTNQEVSDDPDSCIRRLEQLRQRVAATSSGAGRVSPMTEVADAETQSADGAPGRISRRALAAVLVSVTVVVVVVVCAVIGIRSSQVGESAQSGTAADAAARTSTGRVAPRGGECPPSHAIKGNRSSDGDWIFHRPGWEFYTRTGAEDCFASPSDAVAAGYRASDRR